MTEYFLPFSKPSISEEEIDAVGQILRSGWITTGPKTIEFENAFSRYCGATNGVALCSATAGMHLLLRALGIGPGDEVITPSMTWVSTVNMIVLCGATPVFVDVDRHNLMVTAERIAPCITERTKLVVPVHFAGAAADMDPIRRLCAEKSIPLVEDAAHAAGTEYKKEKIGASGTTIFSFHPIKNITTGEGGMFCSDNPVLLDTIRRLKFHGLGVDAYDRESQGRSPQAEVLEPGYKYNMTDIAAVLGLGQLARLDNFIAKRTQLAARYHELLADVDEILPLAVPDYDMRHAWHLFIVRLDTERAKMSRNKLMEELKKKNIGTGIHFLAAHTNKYYRESYKDLQGTLPDTEWNSERICSLPLFPAMTEDNVNDVVQAIKEVWKK